jgi:hypothetical protein
MKRRRGEGEEIPAMAQPPADLSPTRSSTTYRSSQTNRVRKSRAGPRYVDQARFRPRVSNLGDHVVESAFHEVSKILRRAHHRKSDYIGRACQMLDWFELSSILLNWLNSMRHERLARRTKKFCRHIKGNQVPRILEDIVRQLRDEAQKKKKNKYQATVEDAESSEEDFPARKKQRLDAGVVLDDAEFDEEFELDVRWTSGQPGIVSDGPLNLRNRRGKKVRLIDNVPIVIACADGPVIVEEEDGRTLVRDGKNQVNIYNAEDEELLDKVYSDDGDDDSNDEESLSSCSSDSSSSSGSYPGELQPPPSPPTSTLLPWYLIPARIPMSSNTEGKNQNDASTSQRGARSSTQTKPELTLDNARSAKPSRGINTAKLFVRFPISRTPSPPATPPRRTTSELLSRFPLAGVPSSTIPPSSMTMSSPASLAFTTSDLGSPSDVPSKTPSIWQNAIVNAKAEGLKLEARRTAAAKLAAQRRKSAQVLCWAKKLFMRPISGSSSAIAQNTAANSAERPSTSSNNDQTRTTSISQSNASPPLTPLEAQLTVKVKAWKEQSRSAKPISQGAPSEGTSRNETEVATRFKIQGSLNQPNSITLPLNPMYASVGAQIMKYTQESRRGRSEASATRRKRLLAEKKKAFEQFSQLSHTEHPAAPKKPSITPAHRLRSKAHARDRRAPPAQPASNPGLGNSILVEKKNKHRNDYTSKQSSRPQGDLAAETKSSEEARVCPTCTLANAPSATYCEACDASFIVPPPRSHGSDYLEPTLTDDEDEPIMHIRSRRKSGRREAEDEMSAAAGPADTKDHHGNLLPTSKKEAVEKSKSASNLKLELSYDDETMSFTEEARG